jgi:hypothetical protein
VILLARSRTHKTRKKTLLSHWVGGLTEAKIFAYARLLLARRRLCRPKVRLLAPPSDYDNDEAYVGPEGPSSSTKQVTDTSNQYGLVRKFNNSDGGDAQGDSARHAADLETALNKVATMKSMNGSVAHVRDDLDDNYMMSGLAQNQSSLAGPPPPRPPRDDPSLFDGSGDISDQPPSSLSSPSKQTKSMAPRARHASTVEGPQVALARKAAADVARDKGKTSPVGSPLSGRRTGDEAPREPHTGPDYAVAGFAQGLDHASVQRKVTRCTLHAGRPHARRAHTHARTHTHTHTHTHSAFSHTPTATTATTTDRCLVRCLVIT